MNKAIFLSILPIYLISCITPGYDSTKLKTLHNTLIKEIQKKSIYDGFQSRAFFKVIYRSAEIRKKLVDAVAEVESLTESEKESLLKKEIDEENRYFEFCVVLSTTEFKANDLISNNSLWKIFLEDNTGKRELPIQIKEIKADQKIKLLYPGVSRFGKFYHIRFEKKDKTDIKGMTLVFSSILGKAVFKY